MKKITRALAALAILLGMIGPSLAGSPPGIPMSYLGAPGGVPQTDAFSRIPYAAAAQNTQSQARSVTIRSTWPQSGSVPWVTVGGTFINAYQISAQGPATYIQPCWLNAISSGNDTEVDAPNPITTLTASVAFVPGATTFSAVNAGGTVIKQFHFNGSVSTSVGINGRVCADKLFVGGWAPGTVFYIRDYILPGGTGTYPSSQGMSLVGETTNNGSYAYISTTVGNGTVGPYTGVGTSIITGGSPVLPLRPGMMVVGGSVPCRILDDGAGDLTGTCVAAGSINYTTGAWSITFTSAFATGSQFAFYGLGRSGALPTDETMATAATDWTPGTGYLGNVPGFVPDFAPSEVLGGVAYGYKPATLCEVGDSIISAVGNGTEDVSWPEYSVARAVGTIRIGQLGERALQFATDADSFRRMQMLVDKCDKIITDYVTNDINTGASAASIETSLLSVWSKLAAVMPHGWHDIEQMAAIPRTVSQTNNTPLVTGTYGSGTVASGNPSTRNALNAWFCTQVGVTIGHLIDLNTVLEQSPATCAGAGNGLWKSLAYTSDGTHLNYTAQSSVIPAQFGPAGLTPDWAFLP